MSFTTPIALLLLLLLPYFVWLGRPTTTMRSWRRWASVITRMAIIALLTMALAGAQAVRAADKLAVVFLVDASDSISFTQAEQAESYVQQAMATMSQRDEAAVIVFGSNALVDWPMSSQQLSSIQSVPQTIQTDLAEAIRLGMALFPAGSGRRIVVLSDGAATVGNAEEAARLAAASNIEINYIPLLRDQTNAEAWLLNVDAPTRVSEGEVFGIAVSAESTTPQSATIRVLSGGQVISEEDVSLTVGVNNFTVRVKASEQEFSRFTVELVSSADTYTQNNQLAAFTEVVGAPRVLVVSSDGTLDDNDRAIPNQASQLVQALDAAGLNVDRMPPADLPSSLAELSNYASIVLVNVNAKNLTVRKMEALQTYVRDLGGGLVTIGGPKSYGMGGYFKTPLEETLPIDMQIKDTERFPAVSIVIVIDRSGSMGAQEGSLTKIQLAAEGAVRVVELLNGPDEITVITVDTVPDQTIGPYYALEADTIISQLRQLGAGGGGIFVRTGMEAAQNALAGSINPVQHVIVLADGSDSEEKNGVEDILVDLTSRDVTISMIAIGNGPDVPWLREMAELGNGRFHLTDRAANLPTIFTQETTNIQRNYLVEGRFFPTLVSRSPILSGITDVPPLFGYVGTSAKPTAQVVLRTPMDDPLLAQWQYGLGRAVSWTSDATGQWGSEWVQWEKFPAFWAQAVRWTIVQNRDNAIETAIEFTGESAEISVDARTGTGDLLNNLSMEANVVGPDGTVENVTLNQSAPGRYSAEFTPSQEGAYYIRVAGDDDEQAVAVGQTSGWVLGYSPEYKQFETNPQLLQNLADMTGGRDLSDNLDGIFAHNLSAQRAQEPIWHLLTFIALMLLPLDIALRRLVVTREDWSKLYQWSIGRYLPQPVAVAPRTEQASRLFEAKQRAQQDGGQPSVRSEQPPLEQSQPMQDAAPTAVNRPPVAAPEQSAETPKKSALATRLLKKKREQTDKK